MGEAKRKRQQPCICGSARPAEECCWSPGRWKKAASPIKLVTTGSNGAHERCYLRDINSCSDKISREHLVSATVLDAITDTKIDVTGFPWQAVGESKLIGKEALTSNCLCSVHNNALSDLDAAAGYFFRALQICATQADAPSRQFLCSGHDIERWLLKTLSAMAESNNLANDGKRLSGDFHPSVEIAELLQDTDRWQFPLGLYFTQRLGHNLNIDNSISLAPLTMPESDQLVGMLANFQGFEIALFAISAPVTKEFESAYRPSTLRFHLKGAKHTIMLSWQDSHKHGDIEYTLQRPANMRS
jgi:hypothetical protein